jgi:hypothetical protein
MAARTNGLVEGTAPVVEPGDAYTLALGDPP